MTATAKTSPAQFAFYRDNVLYYHGIKEVKVRDRRRGQDGLMYEVAHYHAEGVKYFWAYERELSASKEDAPPSVQSDPENFLGLEARRYAEEPNECPKCEGFGVVLCSGDICPRCHGTGLDA